MDDELLQALAGVIAERVAGVRADVRRELADQLAEVQRAHVAEVTGLRERLADLSHGLELARQGLAAVHRGIDDPVVAFTRDADGGVSLIQRNGPARALPLPDFAALVQSIVDGLADTLRGELHADVARTFELYCNAPAWTATAVYTEGQIVATDIGRTYRVRAGVRATMGTTPGDDPDHWERLGLGGFRVFKSKPDALTAGDVFTERDARFMHDGATTILFVPAAAKHSDIERAVKGPHGLAQATQAELRDHVAHDDALRADVARGVQAANDASELGVQALAATERTREDLDALARRVDEIAQQSAGNSR